MISVLHFSASHFIYYYSPLSVIHTHSAWLKTWMKVLTLATIKGMHSFLSSNLFQSIIWRLIVPWCSCSTWRPALSIEREGVKLIFVVQGMIHSCFISVVLCTCVKAPVVACAIRRRFWTLLCCPMWSLMGASPPLHLSCMHGRTM